MARAKPEAECECCGYENPVGGVSTYNGGQPPRPFLLCEICAGSYASHAVEWHRLYDDGWVKLMKTVAWIGNRLRADLRSS